jgi:hypothetical protein
VRVEVKRGGEGVTGGIKNSEFLSWSSWGLWNMDEGGREMGERRDS